MKNQILLLAIAILMGSCMPNGGQEKKLPDDIQSLKELQSTTKEEVRRLNSRLEKIESKMAEIDPTLSIVQPTLVSAIEIEKGDFDRYVAIQSQVEADETVYLSSETGGRLTNVGIEEGEFIRRGSLVASVDMESVRKQMAEVEKSLELATEVYNRQKRLWDQNIGSEIQYLEARNRKEGLEKTIATLEYQLTKSNIYSPVSGEVDMVLKEGGEVVAPGEPFATVLDTRKVKIMAEVPESHLQSVKKGDKVRIRIPALDLEKEVTVSRIGSTIDPQNRTFKVEAVIPNPGRQLKPNLLADMFINDFSARDVISIPANLLQQEVSGKYFVYLVADANGRKVARKTYVKVGENYDGHILVTEGLQIGDILIDHGSRNVSNSQPVEVQDGISG